MRHREGKSRNSAASSPWPTDISFEELLHEITRRFNALPADEVVEVLFQETMALVCQTLGIDLSSLWQWSDEQKNHFILSHFYTRPGGPANPSGIDARDYFPWILEQVERGELILLSSDKLPEKARHDSESRRFFGVTDTVCVPLYNSESRLYGTISFDALHRERKWSSKEINRLSLVAELFGNVLSRKNAMDTLKKSNERLQMAAESAGAGLWELDLETGLYWATPQARQLFGYRPDQQIDHSSFKTLVVENDLERVQKTIEDAVSTGQPFKVEYRVNTLDGQRRWICSKGRSHLQADGATIRLMGVSLDLTERKEMEEKLQTQLTLIAKLKHKLEEENRYLRKALDSEETGRQVIGSSRSFQRVLTAAQQVAPTDASILLLGETGTGKGVLAQAIHRMSTRHKQPFVVVNCAALPSELIESELFGREKGAFTGAQTKQLGRFELANKGTIFLDEIGDMPLELQTKLLRILQDGEFERLGSPRTIHVDVRVVAATNRDLSECVTKGTFRKDLYYRLKVFPITLPPLRERKSDIPLFVEFFLAKYRRRHGKDVQDIDQESLKKLMNYSWPGNVRELEHLIERALILNSGPILAIDEQFAPDKQPVPERNISLDLESVERNHILAVLEHTGWKIQGEGGAAAALDIHPSTLRFKMKKLNILRPA